MRKILILIFILFSLFIQAQEPAIRKFIDLNGTWQFDQTITAFPPQKFTRTIPVPGLVHLANPQIEEYGKFIKGVGKEGVKRQHNVFDIDYTPRYSWYRRTVFVPKDFESKKAVMTIKKSKYVTQVYVNGMDMGSSMSCYTPIVLPVGQALKYGQENEILVKLGDRNWLPSEAAGGTDKEKEHYLPGIWDDVFITFTGKLRVDQALPLPSVQNKKVTVKLMVRNFNPPQIFSGSPKNDTCLVNVVVSKLNNHVELGKASIKSIVGRDKLTEISVDVDLDGFLLWTPNEPNLCVAEVELVINKEISDKISKNFGMRDFTRKGKFFYLNGEQTKLSGANITLHRFFEDPECANLVWDKEWVKKVLVDIPKSLDWNAMRICVGIVPDFWYELADEYGIMFQNEWLYWQSHGWPDQIKKEYTDWIWSDGAHPSIVIWDAINENYDSYIGNILIPELKKLDPTRIWDAGFMTGDHMVLDEMDEPHPYEGYLPWGKKKLYDDHYPLGKLDYRNEVNMDSMGSGAAQLVNEYGCVWLFRDGEPAKLTFDFYKYFLGENTTPTQNREFQAYWLQLETEWLRSQPYHAGVLAFCYLTNNYGYTGDWFINHIKDLEPSPALHWFKHAFAPQAVFINLTDGRYMKQQEPYSPGSILSFTLYGINDKSSSVNDGDVELLIYDENGSEKQLDKKKVDIPANGNISIPACVTLPEKPGGYLLISKFKTEGHDEVISRRYIKVGEAKTYHFFEIY